MREIIHIQAGQCGNQIGNRVNKRIYEFVKCKSSVFYVLVLASYFR
mgnify:CR=1 FL=1